METIDVAAPFLGHENIAIAVLSAMVVLLVAMNWVQYRTGARQHAEALNRLTAVLDKMADAVMDVSKTAAENREKLTELRVELARGKTT